MSVRPECSVRQPTKHLTDLGAGPSHPYLIHVTESEQPDVKNLIYLTPEWVFSTSANPVLRLRAPSDLQPFSSELALVFKVAGKADKKAGPCCFD